MTAPVIGTGTQHKVTADELLDSRKKEWREFAGTQGEWEDAGPCPRRGSGAELGTELAFLTSLGLALALFLFGSLLAMVSSSTGAKGTRLHVYHWGVPVNEG